jgi:hypothetical protein
MRSRALAWLLASLVVPGCGDDGEAGPPDVYFDLAAPADTYQTFWDLPFPSDLRLDGEGRLELTGYPNVREVPIVEDLLTVARLHVGAPQMPVVYVRFGAEVPERRWTEPVAGAAADVVLVDIDPASPERGRTVPVVVETLALDSFAPPTLVAVAPWPGLVLAPSTTYAVVLRRGFAPGAAAPPDFVALRAGRAPPGPRGEPARALYAPLWPVLADLGVPADDVLVATVFTTGDEVRRMFERSEAIRAEHRAVIGALALEPGDGAAHDGFCALVGAVTFPQFQTGEAPYHTGGLFVDDARGVPIVQGEATVPLVITIPAREMPAAGWPLYLFFHGSGGLSSGVVDLGPIPAVGAEPIAGEGPGFVVARHGIAAASSALPVNPERLPGASAYEYLNLNNLAAFPHTFQQGVFEQRLLLDALLDLEVPAAALAGCAGAALPAGAAAHRFDPSALTAGGQSMGGMYTNLIGAVEPRLGALVPTGAGGFWNLMLLETELLPGARQFVSAAFAINHERANFMQPALGLIGIAFAVAEPVAAMSRLARRPLDAPGFAPRHVYQPVGKDDVYFSTRVFDVAALAYGNQQAGAVAWPALQEALAVDGLDGILAYPVTGNRADGSTGVVVQYESDGIADAHYIYRQLEAVKHQYGCFLASHLAGAATVVAPGALGDPCR